MSNDNVAGAERQMSSETLYAPPTDSSALIKLLSTNPKIFGDAPGQYYYVCAYSGLQCKEAVCIPEATLKGESFF